jgi:hypothetical protein
MVVCFPALLGGVQTTPAEVADNNRLFGVFVPGITLAPSGVESTSARGATQESDTLDVCPKEQHE